MDDNILTKLIKLNDDINESKILLFNNPFNGNTIKLTKNNPKYKEYLKTAINTINIFIDMCNEFKTDNKGEIEAFDKLNGQNIETKDDETKYSLSGVIEKIIKSLKNCLIIFENRLKEYNNNNNSKVIKSSTTIKSQTSKLGPYYYECFHYLIEEIPTIKEHITTLYSNEKLSNLMSKSCINFFYNLKTKIEAIDSDEYNKTLNNILTYYIYNKSSFTDKNKSSSSINVNHINRYFLDNKDFTQKFTLLIKFTKLLGYRFKKTDNSKKIFILFYYCILLIYLIVFIKNINSNELMKDIYNKPENETKILLDELNNIFMNEINHIGDKDLFNKLFSNYDIEILYKQKLNKKNLLMNVTNDLYNKYHDKVEKKDKILITL